MDYTDDAGHSDFKVVNDYVVGTWHHLSGHQGTGGEPDQYMDGSLTEAASGGGGTHTFNAIGDPTDGDSWRINFVGIEEIGEGPFPDRQAYYYSNQDDNATFWGEIIWAEKAQFFYDFAGDTAGNAPAGMTMTWDHGVGSTALVQTVSGTRGGQALEITTGGTPSLTDVDLWTFDAISPDVRDYEI